MTLFQRILHASAGLVFCLFSLTEAQTIAITEINFNSDSTTTSGDWIELYNYGSTTVSLANWTFKDDNDLHVFTFPATTQLAAGARLVLVNDSQKFKSRYPFVSNYLGTFGFGLGNNGDNIRLYDPQGNLFLFIEYADSLPWHPAAAGSGRTLELRSVGLDPNDPNSWFVGCMFGSPGFPFLTCSDQLIFSEINYNPNPLLNAGEWVEIYNRGPTYVNLSGWSFKDRNDQNAFYLPQNLHLAPQGRLVLVADTVLFDAQHPNTNNRFGNFSFNLSNDGELLRLFDFSGKLRFSMVYNDAGDWPKGPDGGGYTLEFSDTTWNVNNPFAWFEGCLGGSPGYAYDPDCITSVPETVSPQPALHLLPGAIVVAQVPDVTATLRLISTDGRLLFQQQLAAGTHTLNLNQHILGGFYLVSLHTPTGCITKKWLLQA